MSFAVNAPYWSRAYRQLVCTVTLPAHIPKWAFPWQVIHPCTKFNHKNSPSVLLSVETVGRGVHQLVLELPPAAASLSGATTGPLGRLIYRTSLTEWISGSAAAHSVVIMWSPPFGEASPWVTLSAQRRGLVGFDARAGVGVGRHTKSQKELSRHEKADSFQITAKLQRRRVCGSERREGVLCFNASLIIIVRGMDCWTAKDLSHISHPQRTMLQRQNNHYLRKGRISKRTKHRMFAGGFGMTWDAAFQLPNTTKSRLSFDRENWWIMAVSVNDALHQSTWGNLCQGSGKVNHDLWLRWTAACVCASVYTANVCLNLKCQSHALVAITAYSAEQGLYDTLLIFDIPVNGATRRLPTLQRAVIMSPCRDCGMMGR